MPDQTVLSVAGATAAAVYGLSNLGKGLLERALGPVADEFGQDMLERYRARNRNASTNRAAEMVDECGRDAHTVPLRTLLPLLDGASREDDPAMQERWAALLANAVIAGDDDGLPPVFASILTNLTPSAARGLELLGTPRIQPVALMTPLRPTCGMTPEQFAALLYPEQDQALYRANAVVGVLVREALVSQTPVLEQSAMISDLGANLRVNGVDLQVTSLGFQFLRACTAPRSSKV